MSKLSLIADKVPKLSTDLDAQGNSLVACATIANLAGQGAALYFDGVDDYINLDALAAELVDVTNTEGAIIWKGKIHDFKTDYLRLWGFGDTDAGEYILLDVPAINNTLRFSCAIDGVLKWRFSTDVTFSEDVEYEIVVTQNGISPVMYVNGEIVPVTVGGSADLAAWFANTTGIDNGRIGCTSYDSGGDVNFLHCTINKFHALNVCPTAAEVLAMYEGGNVPFEYLGASTVENISGTTESWVNNNIGTYNDVGDLSLVTNSPEQYCSLPNPPCVTQTGKTYLFTVDIDNLVGEWFIGSKDAGAQSQIDIADGKGTAVFTAVNNLGLRLTAGSSGSAGDFSNFSLIQIGVIGQYEQDGICHSQWLDKSGNKLHGVIDGALPINLSPSHKEQYPHLTSITDDTAWADVVPAGHMLNYIVFEGENANDATIDLGTTASTDDVFSQEVITGNDIAVVVINKMFSKTAAQSLYLNDDGAGSWNSASLLATLYMSKVEV